MDKLKFAEGLGKKIIEKQHDFFEANESEDIDQIGTFKYTIMAISEYLKSEDLSEDKIDTLSDYFRHLSKTTYIDTCISNKDDDEDDEVFREEAEIWFDYIYENEKYPE